MSFVRTVTSMIFGDGEERPRRKKHKRPAARPKARKGGLQRASHPRRSTRKPTRTTAR